MLNSSRLAGRFTIVAVLCLLGVQPGASQDTPPWQTAPQPPPLPAADESGLAPISDIEMYYAVFNAAGPDPVLLLHGGLGSTANWGLKVPALMAEHKVIVADARGHGRSTRSDQALSYALMASDVVTLLDHLGLEQVKVVGWSDGGIIGLELAMSHPERVSRLFAFGANYDVDTSGNGLILMGG